MSTKTIVTACDRSFVWGFFFLLASIRRHGMDIPVHLVIYGLNPDEKKGLATLPGVRVFEHSDDQNIRNIACQKTEALLTADTEHILWIDSDCIVTGNITQQIEATGEGIQIRLRPEAEVAYLFRNRYAPDEPRGKVPSAVLDVWRRDVGERQEPRINTSCNAHCFAIHRSHLDFVRRWDRQIRKVIPPQDFGIVNDRSFAYFLLDESVMSSMLAFDETAPETQPFVLETDPSARVIHFGGNPKPWKCWMTRNVNRFEEIMDLLDWAVAEGWPLPDRPWNLRRENRFFCVIWAHLFELKRILLRIAYRLKDRLKRWF
ncbi:MAG: hypothetical protein PWQ29_890 [Verrucomicrobiota bacterium]|jgi:hypothetical protein|nr:hypothetical protein [Verrucomicrobiota bacterium]MDK2963496.1 hypothetical protein [Verrucomicrobiota bacterium]